MLNKNIQISLTWLMPAFVLLLVFGLFSSNVLAETAPPCNPEDDDYYECMYGGTPPWDPNQMTFRFNNPTGPLSQTVNLGDTFTLYQASPLTTGGRTEPAGTSGQCQFAYNWQPVYGWFGDGWKNEPKGPRYGSHPYAYSGPYVASAYSRGMPQGEDPCPYLPPAPGEDTYPYYMKCYRTTAYNPAVYSYPNVNHVNVWFSWPGNQISMALLGGGFSGSHSNNIVADKTGTYTIHGKVGLKSTRRFQDINPSPPQSCFGSGTEFGLTYVRSRTVTLTVPPYNRSVGVKVVDARTGEDFTPSGNGNVNWRISYEGTNHNGSNTGSVTVPTHSSGKPIKLSVLSLPSDLQNLEYQISNTENNSDTFTIHAPYIHPTTGLMNMTLKPNGVAYSSAPNSPSFKILVGLAGGAPAPIVDLSSNITEAVHGQTATLSWTTQNVDSCQTSWFGKVPSGSLPNGSDPETMKSTRSYRITCYSENGASVSDEVVIRVRRADSTTIEPGAAANRTLQFDVNLCNSAGVNCYNYEDESIEVYNITQARQVGIFEVGETINLATLSNPVLDTDTLRFTMSDPEGGITKKDICLPEDQGCNNTNGVINVKTICLFAPETDGSCVQPGAGAGGGGEVGLIGRLLSWISPGKSNAQTILGDDFPEVVANYKTNGCFIDQFDINPSDPNMRLGTGDVLEVPPGTSLDMVWQSSGHISNLDNCAAAGPGGDQYLCTSGTLPLVTSYPFITQSGAVSFNAPNTSGLYTLGISCWGSDGRENKRVWQIRIPAVFDISINPNEVVVPEVTGEARECVQVIATTGAGFTGNITLSAHTSNPAIDGRITATFSPQLLSPGSESSQSSQMCVTLDSRAPRGVYDLEVRGTAGGSTASDIAALRLLNLVDGQVSEF